MEPIVKIGLALLDARRRLLVVLKHGGSTYILAGGKPEGEETDLACLARECDEEIGVEIVGTPELLGTFEAKAADMEERQVVVRAYVADILGEPVPQAEIERIHWLDMDNPAVPIADSIRHGVIPALKTQ